MKKKLLILTAALLICALFLQGCVPFLALRGVYEVMTEDRPVIGLLPEDPEEERWPATNDEPVERLYEPVLEYTSFRDMTYSRPDVEAFLFDMDALTKAVESGVDCDQILERFDLLYIDYLHFYTMSTLAYIHYTLDLEDSYYDTEYNWCEEQSPRIEQALEQCYIAMGASSERDELEEFYFGEDFFLYYDTNQIFSDDRTVALMQEEAELQAEYMALQSNLTITWKGEETLLEEVLSDPFLREEEYWTAYDLYYSKYNPVAAEIFIELIRVRREIAQVLGLDSYAEFAYAYYYERDYSPDQAAAYIADIAEDLGPIYAEVYGSSAAAEISSEEVMSLLKDSAHRFGGAIAQAYDFMETYDLYDISASPSKMPGSYMTYLPSYEMPFVYISPTGTMSDFLTATHEFGHFVDSYVNCDLTTSIDCAEIFSQGLEYLVLDVADLSNRQRRDLEEAKLFDSLSVFITQACYSEFERRAYELPDSQLTVDGLNALFLECCEQFANDYPGHEDYVARYWVDIQHFFIAPYYMISYCVSNDAAMQIYQRQVESGDGLELYYDLLQHSAENTVLALLDEVDAQSPFAPDRSEALAKFFEEKLS